MPEATSFLEAAALPPLHGQSSSSSSTSGRDSARTAAAPDGYEERLTEATGVRYRADAYLADMDGGFYSADYLRAWIRSAQLRDYLVREIGEDWWRTAETGRSPARSFLEGTRPVERGDRRAARLRAARHRAAVARAWRLAIRRQLQ